MYWVAVSGSWRKIKPGIETAVRKQVREIFENGNGLISGGALNVDAIALDEALKCDPKAEKIKIFIPAPLEIFAKHYKKKAGEKIITDQQALQLIGQLERLKNLNLASLTEGKSKKINQDAYFERNSEIIKVVDELIAFWVNQSPGVADTIKKAKRKGIPLKIYKYNF